MINNVSLEILVSIRDIYGNQTIYPECDKSKLFARIAGTKTLPIWVIEQIKLLGYTVCIKQQPIKMEL
jgi:hypothetical protein